MFRSLVSTSRHFRPSASLFLVPPTATVRFLASSPDAAAPNLEHPEFQQFEMFENEEHDFFSRTPAPVVVDPVLEESNIGWRGAPTIPTQLVSNLRQLASEHNVKRINERFDTMEERRLHFSLQELEDSSWFQNIVPSMVKESGVVGFGKGFGKGSGKTKTAGKLAETKEEEEDGSDMQQQTSMTSPPRRAPVVYGPEESLAYVVRRSIPVYTSLSRVFAEVQRRVPTFEPKTLLDFGAGPGTVVWSADTVWPGSLGFEAGSFTLVEHSRSMEELSQKMLVNGEKNEKISTKIRKTRLMAADSPRMNELRNTGPNIGWRNSIRDLVSDAPSVTLSSPSSSASTSTSTSTRLLSHHLHDVVLAANVISELKTDVLRDASIEVLWKLTAPGGVLIVVERGNRWGSHVANRARQLVLDLDPTSAHVVAPCTHNLQCPMIQNKGGMNEKTWCHFAHRTGDEEIRKIVGNRSPQHRPSYDKFSYVVLQKRHQTKKKNESEEEEEEAAAAAAAAWDAHVQWSRIIKPPLRRGKHVIVDVCTSHGVLQRKTFGKRRHKKGGVYRAARKSEWGAMWGDKEET